MGSGEGKRGAATEVSPWAVKDISRKSFSINVLRCDRQSGSECPGTSIAKDLRTKCHKSWQMTVVDKDAE